MLFTPQWTELEEVAKKQLLEGTQNFSALTNEELCKAISKIGPKSDWERFFSCKVNVDDTEASIKRLSIFRNSVAHVKFFHRSDYEECRKLIKSLNLEILEAIQITEEHDFVEKNMEALHASVIGVLEKFQNFNKWVGERVSKTTRMLMPAFEKVGRVSIMLAREDRIQDI